MKPDAMDYCVMGKPQATGNVEAQRHHRTTGAANGLEINSVSSGYLAAPLSLPITRRFGLHTILALVLSVYGAHAAKYTNPGDSVTTVSQVLHPASRVYPTDVSLKQSDTEFWRSCDECFNRHLGCSKAKSGDKAWTCVKDHY